MLLLAEEVLLLSLDDESGKLSSMSAPYINYTIAGALLMELAFANKIEFSEDGKKAIVILKDQTPTDNPILDETIKIIAGYEKERKLDKMINKIAGKYSDFRTQLFERLVQSQILTRTEKTRMKIFKVVRHPIQKPEIKDEILSEIQTFVLENKTPSDHLIGLLGLIGATEMIGTVFTKEYRKQAKEKIKEIIESDVIGSTLKKIIQSIQTALMVTIIASTTAAAAATR